MAYVQIFPVRKLRRQQAITSRCLLDLVLKPESTIGTKLALNKTCPSYSTCEECLRDCVEVSTDDVEGSWRMVL